MREVPARGHTPALPGLVGSLAVSLALMACGAPPTPSIALQTIVMDDFESGALSGWREVGSGAGGWFVYRDGQQGPDPAASSDPVSSFRLPGPPQGTFAAATEANGPGTHILYRDLTLDGRFTLRMIVYYTGSSAFSTPETLAHDALEANQQFRIDVIDPSAPIDSVATGDVLVNIFRTSTGDPFRRQPTEVSVGLAPVASKTVRFRIVQTDNQGPMRVGVDNIRFEPVGPGDATVALLETQDASDAIDLVLRRMSEAEALAALSARADELERADEFSGAFLVAHDGKVLLQEAHGLADREGGTPNTLDTKFRIGSMNKMFTSVATLQLIEAGTLALDDPVGKHLPDYPNKDVASKVTVRHLLSHTGGTGDFFGPQFDRNRETLREHSDYVKLFGTRGPAFEPGARFEYSNYGFVLLGAIIEAATGRSYYEVVRENVFGPAGMTSTDSLPESEDVPSRSIGYMRQSPTSGWMPNTDSLPWRGTSAGGGYSTVGDLMRFGEALRAGTLISKATLAEAASPQSEEPYGFGLDMRGDGALRSYGHGGGAPGMNGELRVFPDLGYVVVSLSNLDPPAAGRLVEFFELRMPDR
jgi:D-alanyl-D-alanine carboxypeptidase